MGRIKPEVCDIVEPVRVAQGSVVSPASRLVSRLLGNHGAEPKMVKQVIGAPSYWVVAQHAPAEQAEEMDASMHELFSSLKSPTGMDGCCEIALLEWFASKGHNLARHRKDTGWALIHDLATSHAHRAKAAIALRWLVRHGVDVNQVSNRNFQGITTLATPLHLAVSVRCPDLITALIESGADVSRINKLGKTPLLFAPGPDPGDERLSPARVSPVHAVEIFDLLVTHGADKFATVRPPSRKDEHAGKTLADLAYGSRQLAWCQQHGIRSRSGDPVINEGWTLVQVHGLTKAAHRNGQRGTVLRYNRESSRYEVRMDDASQLALKLENLRFEPDASSVDVEQVAHASAARCTPGAATSSAVHDLV